MFVAISSGPLGDVTKFERLFRKKLRPENVKKT